MVRASQDPDAESEFGGVPGLVPPADRVTEYLPRHMLSAHYANDPTVAGAVDDPQNIGKDRTLNGWDGNPASIA